MIEWIGDRSQNDWIFAFAGVAVLLAIGQIIRAEKHHAAALDQAERHHREAREFYLREKAAEQPKPEVLFWNHGQPTDRISVTVPKRAQWFSDQRMNEVIDQRCAEEEAKGFRQHAVWKYRVNLTLFLAATRRVSSAWICEFEVAIFNRGKGDLSNVRAELQFPSGSMLLVDDEYYRPELLRIAATAPAPPQTRDSTHLFGDIVLHPQGERSDPLTDSPAVVTFLDEDYRMTAGTPRINGEDCYRDGPHLLYLEPLNEPELEVPYSLWSAETARVDGTLYIDFDVQSEESEGDEGQ